MKICLFLLGVCLFQIIQSLPFKKLSKEEQEKIALKCIAEVNIERSVIEEVLKTEELPQDDRKYKKFLACSYKKQGFLSPDGTEMMYSNILQFLTGFYDSAQLKAIEHCKEIKSEDAGELCFRNLECILDGLRAIEADSNFESNFIPGSDQ